MTNRNNKQMTEGKPPASLDSRDSQRVPFHCPVLYSSQDEARPSQKKGQLVDLSKRGCRILGPVLAVGCTTTIMLDLSDGKAVLSIAGATVCWNDGYSFGVSFPMMPVEDPHRLQELVLKFVTLKGANLDRAAFRLA